MIRYMSEMENKISHRHRVMEELTRGRQFAHQLRQLLIQSRALAADATSTCAELDLAFKILTSFTHTLLLLHCNDSYSEGLSVSQMQAPKSEDSQESRKSTSIRSNRRGCYKRRRTSQTWERDTTALVEDGHAWRKYGQKVILNAEHPRSYFRCTHKNDQECLATKQVQQVQDEPPLYRTTYHGHHTCKDLLKAPPFIIDDPTTDSDHPPALLVSFENNAMSANQNHHHFLSSFQSLNRDCDQEANSNINTHTARHPNQSSSSSDYLLSPTDLTVLSSNMQSQQGAVMSDFVDGHADEDDFQQYLVF